MSLSLPRKGTMRARAVAAASQKIAGTMRLKLLVVGDSNSGKSTLIRRYNADAAAAATSSSNQSASSSAQFDVTSSPTVGVDFVAASVVGSRPADGVAGGVGRSLRVQANFFDMAGDPLYAKVRAEFFADQHGVLFAFDLTNRASWEHVESQWWVEVSTRPPPAEGGSAPPPAQLHAVVVGCKLDLIESGEPRGVSERDVRQWCKSRGASYFECSSRNGQGVSRAIEYLIEHAQAEVRVTPAQPAAAGAARPSSASSSHPSRPPSAAPHHSPSSSFSSGSSGPASIGGGGVGGGAANISEMSLSELRRECSKRGIDTSQCLEKSDVLAKLREGLARERAAKDESAAEARAREERARENVLADVARWARGKDVRAMLNDIHGWSESDPSTKASYLPAHASLAPVSAAYKRALLKIHPDKVDAAREPTAHLRATEMFKTVNAAFEVFKKTNEKRASNGAEMMGAAAAAAPPPAHSPTASPTPRQRPARR